MIYLFLSFLFIFGIRYLFLMVAAIIACHLGERTVRIRKVKGSNPSVSTKKKDRQNACPSFWSDERDSNHNRTPRWGVHRPVQTLVDTIISFRRPTQGEKKCKRIPPSLLLEKMSLLLLLLVNAAIGFVSYKLYLASKKK